MITLVLLSIGLPQLKLSLLVNFLFYSQSKQFSWLNTHCMLFYHLNGLMKLFQFFLTSFFSAKDCEKCHMSRAEMLWIPFPNSWVWTYVFTLSRNLSSCHLQGIFTFGHLKVKKWLHDGNYFWIKNYSEWNLIIHVLTWRNNELMFRVLVGKQNKNCMTQISSKKELILLISCTFKVKMWRFTVLTIYHFS